MPVPNVAKPYQNALIVGAGVGLSASLARALSNAGLTVALALAAFLLATRSTKPGS